MHKLGQSNFCQLQLRLANSTKARRISLLLGNALEKNPEFHYNRECFLNVFANIFKFFYGLDFKTSSKIFEKLFLRLRLFFSSNFNGDHGEFLVEDKGDRWLSLNMLTSLMGSVYYLIIQEDHGLSDFLEFWVYVLKKVLHIREKRKGGELKLKVLNQIDLNAEERCLIICEAEDPRARESLTESGWGLFQSDEPTLENWEIEIQRLKGLTLSVKGFDHVNDTREKMKTYLMNEVNKKDSEVFSMIKESSIMMQNEVPEMSKEIAYIQEKIEKKSFQLVFGIERKEGEKGVMIVEKCSAALFLLEEVEMKSGESQIINILDMRSKFLEVDNKKRTVKNWKIHKQLDIVVQKKKKEKIILAEDLVENILIKKETLLQKNQKINNQKRLSTSEALKVEMDQIFESESVGITLEDIKTKAEKRQEEQERIQSRLGLQQSNPKIMIIGKKYLGKSEIGKRLAKGLDVEFWNVQKIQNEILKRFKEDEETAEEIEESIKSEKEEEDQLESDNEKLSQENEKEESLDSEQTKIKNEESSNIVEIDEVIIENEDKDLKKKEEFKETKKYNLTTFEEREQARLYQKNEMMDSKFLLNKLIKKIKDLYIKNRGYVIELNTILELEIMSPLFLEVFSLQTKNEIDQFLLNKRKLLYDYILELDLGQEDVKERIRGMRWVNLKDIEETTEETQENEEVDDIEIKEKERAKEVLVSVNQIRNISCLLRLNETLSTDEYTSALDQIKEKNENFDEKFFRFPKMVNEISENEELKEVLNRIIMPERQRPFLTEEKEKEISEQLFFYEKKFRPLLQSFLEKFNWKNKLVTINVEGLSRENIFLNSLLSMPSLKAQIMANVLEGTDDWKELLESPKIEVGYLERMKEEEPEDLEDESKKKDELLKYHLEGWKPKDRFDFLTKKVQDGRNLF